MASDGVCVFDLERVEIRVLLKCFQSDGIRSKRVETVAVVDDVVGEFAEFVGLKSRGV